MKYVVDRFEGEYAVCEDENRKMLDIKKNKLPEDVKEGDSIVEKDGIYTIDKNKTKNDSERIKKKMDDLFK